MGFVIVPFLFIVLLLRLGDSMLHFGHLFTLITFVTPLIGLVGLIGYWKMRKWGVYVYTFMAVISILCGILFNIQGIMGYIGPIVISIIGFANFKKMT